MKKDIRTLTETEEKQFNKAIQSGTVMFSDIMNHPKKSLSAKDYIVGVDLAQPEEVTVVFTLQPSGARIYVDVPYNSDEVVCQLKAIYKLSEEQGIMMSVMEYTWEVIVD